MVEVRRSRWLKIGALLGSISSVMTLVLIAFQWLNITPSSLMPYSLDIVLGFASISTILVVSFLIAYVQSKRIRITIIDLIKPEYERVHMRPLNVASFPTEGWIGTDVTNNSDNEIRGCFGKMKTDVGEFLLYDWETYERNPKTREGADPYKVFNFIRYETKRLYAHIKTNTTKVSVILDVGKKTINRELSLSELT